MVCLPSQSPLKGKHFLSLTSNVQYSPEGKLPTLASMNIHSRVNQTLLKPQTTTSGLLIPGAYLHALLECVLLLYKNLCLLAPARPAFDFFLDGVKNPLQRLRFHLPRQGDLFHRLDFPTTGGIRKAVC